MTPPPPGTICRLAGGGWRVVVVAAFEDVAHVAPVGRSGGPTDATCVGTAAGVVWVSCTAPAPTAALVPAGRVDRAATAAVVEHHRTLRSGQGQTGHVPATAAAVGARRELEQPLLAALQRAWATLR